jgi:PAS domain S-box-containing protein
MKKKTLLFLRFILILCTVLLMTYSKRGLAFPEPGYTIALIYFISNLILYFLSDKILSKAFVSFFIYLFDILTISVAIYYIQGLESDFYLINFMVIFIASVSQNISGSLPIAIVASTFYGWLIYRSDPHMSLLSPSILLRVPFLFIISLISSYWSANTRRELQKKEKLERFNRKLKEEVNRIAAEEIRLRRYSEKIMNNVPSGVIAVRNDGTITTVNIEAAKIFGLKIDELKGKDIRQIEKLGTFWKRMQESIDTGVVIDRDEAVIRNIDDEEVFIGFSISPIMHDHGSFHECVTIFKNLSEIKILQEKLKQAEKLSYLGKMASWVAHEIRNPLAVIDGFAQLLMTATNYKKMKLYGVEIHNGTQRINFIVDDILAFARTRKKKPKLLLINLRSLIAIIVNGFDIDVTVNGEAEPVVEGEIEPLRRVFVNLITNSVESMNSEGQLEITFSIEEEHVVTKISDNGAGISDQNMKNLFTPFFTTKERGTGLGLAIVEKIIEEHNGKVEIQSTEGVGTAVYVYLPAKRSGAVTIEVPGKSRTPEPLCAKSPKRERKLYEKKNPCM